MKLLIIILSIITFNLQAQPKHPPVYEGMTSDTTVLLMNDLSVNLVKYTYGEPNINFIAIHDNEDTGVKAAFEYIRLYGGTIIDSQYGGLRNFKLVHNEEEFQIDPNGIYTTTGITKGLEKYNRAEPAVVKMMGESANTILKLYSSEKPSYIFALHNNGDGGYGIPSYLKGYELAQFADSLHINFQMDPDDLILVTDTALFNGLKKENVNVVLQSKNAPDDGSLSFYAMQQDIPYINVEVQHGHLEEHYRLIEVAIKVLKQVQAAPVVN
jgi:hypothetical protein